MFHQKKRSLNEGRDSEDPSDGSRSSDDSVGAGAVDLATTCGSSGSRSGKLPPKAPKRLARKRAKAKTAKSCSIDEASDESKRPARPLSAYNLFFRDERQRLVDSGEAIEAIYDKEVAPSANAPSKRPQDKFQFLVKVVSRRWNVLPPDDRRPYEAMAKVEMENYQKRLMEYRDKELQDAINRPKTPPPNSQGPSGEKTRANPLRTEPSLDVRKRDGQLQSLVLGANHVTSASTPLDLPQLLVGQGGGPGLSSFSQGGNVVVSNSPLTAKIFPSLLEPQPGVGTQGAAASMTTGDNGLDVAARSNLLATLFAQKQLQASSSGSNPNYSHDLQLQNPWFKATQEQPLQLYQQQRHQQVQSQYPQQQQQQYLNNNEQVLPWLNIHQQCLSSPLETLLQVFAFLELVNTIERRINSFNATSQSSSTSQEGQRQIFSLLLQQAHGKSADGQDSSVDLAERNRRQQEEGKLRTLLHSYAQQIPSSQGDQIASAIAQKFLDMNERSEQENRNSLHDSLVMMVQHQLHSAARLPLQLEPGGNNSNNLAEATIRQLSMMIVQNHLSRQQQNGDVTSTGGNGGSDGANRVLPQLEQTLQPHTEEQANLIPFLTTLLQQRLQQNQYSQPPQVPPRR